MTHGITPLSKLSLADNLAIELKKYILKNRYYSGKKLPSTTELARKFGVGMPTLREAIKKLETIGAIQVKHGSGIFVGEQINNIILANPLATSESPSKKHLLDLIDARMSVEIATAELAAKNATPDDISKMENLLAEAKSNFDDEIVLTQKNMAFHLAIASASGNVVFSQLVEVVTKLFRLEQRLIIDIFRHKEKDYIQHLEIFDAIRKHDAKKTGILMRAHLESVREAIRAWHG